MITFKEVMGLYWLMSSGGCSFFQLEEESYG
jgi:hypothetical protein